MNLDTPISVVITYVAYWVLFWSVINALLPPREIFNDWPGFQKGYNLILLLVAYWGSMNVRSLTVKVYGQLGVPLASASTLNDEKKKDQ